MESLNNSTTTLSENPSKTLDHSNPWINTTSKYVYQKHHIPAKNQPFLQDKVVKSNKDSSKPKSNIDMNASKTTQASTASIPATTHATIALNYSNKNLKAVAQSVLDYKNSLLILDLSCNTLTDFPNEILELVKLKSLKLDSNKLKKIPSEISDLRQLENLSLASNYITALPNTIGQFSKTLSALNISNNRIDSFPEGFTDLVNLKILLIQKNWFISFPTGFSSFTGLKEFSLEWFKYASPPLPVEQNDPKCDNIQKLFNLCTKLQSAGKLEVRFEDFLEHFSSPDQDHFAVKDSAGRNLLHLAALEEDIGIVRALAKNRPQLRDEIDQHKQSPLSLAVREERNLAAKVLLMNGVNPNIGSGPVGSPLNVATATYRCGLVKDLLKYGANPNAIDVEGNTPLHLICSIFAKGPKIAQEIGNLLIGAGADPNLLNYDSWSPLHLAIRRGQTECLKWIIEANKKEESHVSKPFDLNIKGGSDQWTPLHLAAGLGHFEVLNLLVDNDVDISATTKTGRTPRDVAVNNVIICKVLKKIEDEWIHNQLFNQPTLESKLREFSASTSVLHLKHMIHSTSNEMLAREKIKINGKLQASRDSKSTGMMPGAGMLRTKHKSDNNRRESGLMRKKTTLRLEDCDRDVSHGESTMLDNIDEVVETREITRMVPRSPNNIQKIQIAQNYRDHVLRNSFSRENGSQILHTVNTCVNTYMNTVNQYTLTCADYQSPNKKDKSRLLTNLSPQGTRKTKMAPQSFIFPNEFNNFMKNFESYLDEIKTYQNLLIQETGVSLAEKLKHLFYLQVLHMKINGTLGKISSETIPVELFILCEHIEDELKKGKDQFKKNGIVHNYDIIPRTLLFIFENMDSKKSQKNTLLKIRISKLFGLFKYESAKHFLQQVVQNDKETRPLRTAANDALNIVSKNNPLSANSLLCNDLKYRDRGIVNHLVSPKHDVLNKAGKNNIFPTSSSLSISSKPNKRTFSCMGPVPVKCENIEDDEERQGQGTRKQHDMPNNAPLRSRPDLLKTGVGFTGFRGVQDPLPSKFQSFSCKHSDFHLQISTEDTNKSDVMRSLEVKRTPKRAGVENYFSQV